MTDPEQEFAHLKKLQAKHRRNIHALEEQLANYGIDRPLHLLNSLDFEQEQLRQVEERLAELAARAEPVEASTAPTEPREVGRKEQPTAQGDWDVFISHAWEDKEAFARPLAKALEREGLRVWYDEFTLRVGDSLRRSIDHGLANSRYGVVILSPNFFAKEWPQKELDGLVAREAPGEKVILPVWHNVTADQIRKYSPTLADRVAVLSDRGLEHVVKELLRVIELTSEPNHRLRFGKDKPRTHDSPEPTLPPRLSYSQSLQLFDDRMCEAFPGARGLVVIEDPAGIKRCLDIVLKPPLITDPLLKTGWIRWWRGNIHNKITTYSYLLKEQIYLIDEWELDIKLLAGYRATSQDLQYVYVESDPLKSSGVRFWANQDIDDMINTSGVAYEDIAVFEGHYISRPEYHDGFANINGQVVSVMGRSKPRKRPLTRFNLLIAPKETRLNNIDFEDKLEAICNQILAGQASLDELVDAINRIRWGLSFPPNWIE